MVRDKIPAFLEFFSGWETGNQFIKTQIMSGSKCYGGIWISAVHRRGGGAEAVGVRFGGQGSALSRDV